MSHAILFRKNGISDSLKGSEGRRTGNQHKEVTDSKHPMGIRNIDGKIKLVHGENITLQPSCNFVGFILIFCRHHLAHKCRMNKQRLFAPCKLLAQVIISNS